MRQKVDSNRYWVVLAVASLLAFAMWASVFCVPPMEHLLKEELQLTYAQTGLLFTAPIITMIALTIPGGLIADRIGIRKTAGVGAIILAAGTLLRGTANDASSLLAFSLMCGVGLGLSFPNLPKLVSTRIPLRKAGIATGVFSAGLVGGSAVALAITVPVILPISNTFQGVFFFWSIPAIVAATLWWVLIREPPGNENNAGLSRAGLGKTLGNKSLWLVAVVLLLHNFFAYTWLAWLPDVMITKGATPDTAGLVTSIFQWVAIPTLFLVPRLAFKLGLRKLFIWLPSIALAISAWALISVNLSLVWLVTVIAGVFSIVRFSTIMALPVELIPREDVGVASGLVLSIGYSGAMIGPLVGGRILDLTASPDISLVILVIVSSATAGITLRLPETGRKGAGG